MLQRYAVPPTFPKRRERVLLLPTRVALGLVENDEEARGPAATDKPDRRPCRMSIRAGLEKQHFRQRFESDVEMRRWLADVQPPGRQSETVAVAKDLGEAAGIAEHDPYGPEASRFGEQRTAPGRRSRLTGHSAGLNEIEYHFQVRSARQFRSGLELHHATPRPPHARPRAGRPCRDIAQVWAAVKASLARDGRPVVSGGGSSACAPGCGGGSRPS